MDGKLQTSMFQRILNRTPISSIEKVMDYKPSKGQSRIEKYTDLIMGLIEDVPAIMLEIN